MCKRFRVLGIPGSMIYPGVYPCPDSPGSRVYPGPRIFPEHARAYPGIPGHTLTYPETRGWHPCLNCCLPVVHLKNRMRWVPALRRRLKGKRL